MPQKYGLKITYVSLMLGMWPSLMLGIKKLPYYYKIIEFNNQTADIKAFVIFIKMVRYQ